MNFIFSIIRVYRDINLMLRILIGLLVGAVLGIFVPDLTLVPVLGKLFVGALKAIAPILVALLVASSIAKSREGLGKKFRTVITLYLSSTLVAAVVAVFASRLFPLVLQLPQASGDQGAAPDSIGAVFLNIATELMSNPITAVTSASYLSILMWSIIIGFALRRKASPSTINIIHEFASVLVLSILATFAACGASGVAGGSLLLIPMACSLFGISQDVSMQVVAVGFIISVVQDSVETALNSSGDVFFTATADYYNRRMSDGQKS